MVTTVFIKISIGAKSNEVCTVLAGFSIFLCDDLLLILIFKLWHLKLSFIMQSCHTTMWYFWVKLRPNPVRTHQEIAPQYPIQNRARLNFNGRQWSWKEKTAYYKHNVSSNCRKVNFFPKNAVRSNTSLLWKKHNIGASFLTNVPCFNYFTGE